MLPTPWTRGTLTSPFETLWDMRREVDRLLDGFGGFARLGSGDVSTWSMPTEVRESADEIRFMIEIPGLRPDDIDLTVENNVLTVSGEKKFEREEDQAEGDYRLFERRYGRFQRSFTIPATVDANAIGAEYENGVLTLTLPKSEAAKPRRIEIGRGSGAKQINAQQKTEK